MTDAAKQSQDAPQAPWLAAEVAHLARVLAQLEAALREAGTLVEQLDADYLAAKRYLAEYRHEIDPRELFQDEQRLQQLDRQGVFAVNARERLAKLLDSPYFARLDFQPAGAAEAARHYIGRFTFQHENEVVVSDWRSPVAGLYYDCEVGPAAYDAPAGRIEGALTRKRQFKIKQGALEYALESADSIRDEVLERELSHTADEKMKSIIATIQKEQNRVIRNENAATLLIQGVAGSGKTSIALHRVAYLLYRFQERLTAQNVAILSPNCVFGDYIANVLPELGEEPISETSCAELAAAQLAGVIAFEPERDPLETADAAWAERVRLKSSLQFLHRLDEYLAHVAERFWVAADYRRGAFQVERAWLLKRLNAYQSQPLQQRLVHLAGEVHTRWRSEHTLGEKVPGEKVILKDLRKMLPIKDTLTLYRDFYAQQQWEDQFVMPKPNTLEWTDVYPFLYVQDYLTGLPQSKRIRHLLIDEMQDYTPVQHAVIARLFPCPKTVLGDFGQCFNPYHSHTLADLRALYADAELVELHKSYRSSYEIINFAKRIQNVGGLEAVERHGASPQVLACTDEVAELTQIRRVIARFQAGERATLGVILKTNGAARALYQRLAADLELHLLTPESARFQSGVTIASVRLAKGLEFDEVLIPQADDRTYVDEYDRSLLYIACTRALHELILTHTGRPTRLLAPTESC